MNISRLSLFFAAHVFLMSGLAGAGEGPYIDSAGLRAAQSRLEAVDGDDADSLINQAFRVQNKLPSGVQGQPDFFKSIEDDYQRYRKLFTLHKRGPVSGAYCPYDLLETFKREVFDAQPFLNAILHTLSLPDVTTLSYSVVSRAPDNITIRVSWSKAVAQEGGKGFAIAEGTSDIKVARHWISLVAVR